MGGIPVIGPLGSFLMGDFGASDKGSDLPPPPPMPQPAQPLQPVSVSGEIDEAKKQSRLRRGRASTYGTSRAGVPGLEDMDFQRKTLLGE